MDNASQIRSISRALNVLKAVNRLQSPTLTEIARETELPYPTAFRIVQALSYDGMIEQEPFRKRYRATELVKSLSFGFQEDDRLQAAAVEPMQTFTNRYLWPVTITVRVGTRMMVKHSTHKLTSLTFFNYYPGHTLPILESSSGRAYLAFCDAEERDTILRGFGASLVPEQANILRLLGEESLLDDIRRQHYAEFAYGQHNATPGRTSAFSVPLFDGDHLVACITIVFFAFAHSMTEAVALYLAPMQQLAKEIGEKLALPSPLALP